MIDNFWAIHNERKERGEKGFSLIELIVVVVVLGILVAIAIPIYGKIQERAELSALDTTAANTATSVAAAIATENDSNSKNQLAAKDVIESANNTNSKANISTCGPTYNTDIDNVCVKVTGKYGGGTAEVYAGTDKLVGEKNKTHPNPTNSEWKKEL